MYKISEANIKDIERIRWFYDTYNKVDIPYVLTYKMQLCNQFKLTAEQLDELDNYLKAIRQDIRKIFLSIQNIDTIYSLREDYKNISDIDRETVAIYIEYVITKYRVIIEYTLNVLDMVVSYSGSQYKENGKKFSSTEMYNMKLDYLRSLIDDDRNKILNGKWFQSIRKTRNSIIHNGATCLVFGDIKEKLFQIYDLEVEELVRDDFYLYNRNCVHFDYFIILNIAYLCYFIDSIFSIILDKINYEENLDWVIQTSVNNMLNSVGDKQNSVMKWTKNIIDKYDNEIKIK